MSRLTRLFSKRHVADDDSGSEDDNELMNDTAGIEASPQSDEPSHSVGDWDDWSINEEMISRLSLTEDGRGSEQMVPLNDKGSTSDGEGKPAVRPTMSKKQKSMNDLHLNLKKKKKEKSKSSGVNDDSKTKKAKKRSTSGSIQEADSTSVASSDANNFSNSQSTKTLGDDVLDRSAKSDGTGDSRRSKKREKLSDAVPKSPNSAKKKKKKEKKKKSKTDGASDTSGHSRPPSIKEIDRDTDIEGDRYPSTVEESTAKAEEPKIETEESSTAFTGEDSKGKREETTAKAARSRSKSRSRARSKSRTRSKSQRAVDKRSPSRSRAGLDKPKSKNRGTSKRDLIGSQHKKRKSSSKKKDLPTMPALEDILGGGEEAQRQEILRLHQMLSDALQKVATQSAEQIQDKDELLKASAELSKIKADHETMQKERDNLETTLEDRDEKIEKYKEQVDKLIDDLERQREDQALVEADLKDSEADVDRLLIKIEDLERATTEGSGVNDEKLREELKESKMTIVDKNREIESQKARVEKLETDIESQKTKIGELEQEVKDTESSYKLQVDEIEAERQALEGKLKGERLELNSKLHNRDEAITALEQELTRYRGNSEFEEIAVVRDDLEKAQNEAEVAVKDSEAAQKALEKARSEKEELVERNNKLNAEVKRLDKSVNELTAKSNQFEELARKRLEETYEWKAKVDTVEKKLAAIADGNDVVSDSGSTADEAPQGLFLQAIMDKQENSKKTAGRWGIFSRTNGQVGDDDQTAEEVRIQNLEEQNQSLQNKNMELESNLVKLKSAHKEEVYLKKKEVSQLVGENEALKVKNQTLEELCGER